MQYDINGRILASDVNDLIAEEISVFPNPTTDKVMIQGFSQPLTAANYSVFSVDGKQVDVDVLNKQILDTGSLESGIYFLRIAAQEGTETIRFVKE
jgi:hypothetical protein